MTTTAVYALGLTYAEHASETGLARHAAVVFRKHCQALRDPGEFVLPTSAEVSARLRQLDPALAAWLDARACTLPVLLDYEVELGMRLLADCCLEDLADSEHALPLAYFVANDLTARGLQMCGHKAQDPLPYWSAAKSMPGMLPIGADECLGTSRAWPEVELVTRVNGEVRQRASTAHLLYSPGEILERVLRQAPEQRLYRDDLILTGTPAGVAWTTSPWQQRLARLLPRRPGIALALRRAVHNRRFLQAGDVLEFSGGELGQVTLRITAATQERAHD